MNILYQYYNEIVLAFNDYEVDLQEGIVLIFVPDDNKPFEVVCQKIDVQLHRISETLDPRDKEITIRVERSNQAKDIILQKQV